MSKIIKGRPIYFDVDSTLCFDGADFPEGDTMPKYEVACFGRFILVVPHWEQCRLMEKLYNRGYTIIVHSHSGPEWAEAVSKALRVDEFVTHYISKPQYYVDDLPVEQWYGERVYREFKQ